MTKDMLNPVPRDRPAFEVTNERIDAGAHAIMAMGAGEATAEGMSFISARIFSEAVLSAAAQVHRPKP